MAKDSLVATQSFDVASIVRADTLGVAFDFAPVEESARDIVDLFKQVDAESLALLPSSTLHSLVSISELTRQLFQQCIEFNPTQSNASSTRESIISSINSHISTVFSALSPIIAYLSSQQSGAKATLDNLLRELGDSRTRLDSVLREAESAKAQAANVLETVRSASGNVGVSNEASYFMDAAEAHKTASDNWKTATIGASVALLLYSIGTAFLHKWTWFMPTTNIGLTQFIVSKILIFGVLGYLLTLCAKNFLNHKHNEIVNKHRQNSLLTYETMVNAGKTEEARNIVLQLAAASVYQLHDTGYVKSSEGAGRGGIIEILPKTSIPLSSGGTP